MKQITLIGISSASLLFSMLLFAFWNRWIIVNFPSHTKSQALKSATILKKKIELFYWHDDNWKREEMELIWSNDNATNIQYLINNLLSLMEEEEALAKKISIESVMIDPTGNEAFISFDRNPLRKEASTFEKWMIIESILKTIKENKIPIKSVRFLVHHKPINDYHLDFSKGWQTY